MHFWNVSLFEDIFETGASVTLSANFEEISSDALNFVGYAIMEEYKLAEKWKKMKLAEKSNKYPRWVLHLHRYLPVDRPNFLPAFFCSHSIILRLNSSLRFPATMMTVFISSGRRDRVIKGRSKQSLERDHNYGMMPVAFFANFSSQFSANFFKSKSIFIINQYGVKMTHLMMNCGFDWSK